MSQQTKSNLGQGPNPLLLQRLLMEPISALGVVGNLAVEPVAAEASARLHRVAARLVGGA